MYPTAPFLDLHVYQASARNDKFKGLLLTATVNITIEHIGHRIPTRLVDTLIRFLADETTRDLFKYGMYVVGWIRKSKVLRKLPANGR
jgi:hypothetical protein